MDGNGRWAKAQGKPRTAGHLVGSDNVRTIAIAQMRWGLNILHSMLSQLRTGNEQRMK